MEDLFNLSAKNILITGAAGLLGRQHAEAVVSHGGTAIIADIDYAAAQQVSAKLNQKYGGALAVAEYMDVLNKESITQVCDKYDRIDILINNAAKDTKVEKKGDLTAATRFETMSYEYWQDDMKVGLDGCFLCSQVVASKMVEAGGGAIVNVASDLSVIAPDQRIYKKADVPDNEQYVKPVTYSVSKWAILGLTKYMSTYYADKNIRVNSLSPGGLYSPNLPNDFVARLTSLIPMGRMARTNEYAGVIIFLCSDASSYMTGQNIIMDGGRTVW